MNQTHPAVGSLHGGSPARLGAVLLVAIAYAGVARSSQFATSLPGHMSPIFPAAGIGLAAALILGRQALLGIWLGSFAANAVRSASILSGIAHLNPKTLLVTTSVGIGAALAAGAGAWIVRRSCGDEDPLHSAHNIAALVTMGATTSAAISATVGVLTLSTAGISPWGIFGYSWFTWFLGDAFGIVIAVPLIFAWLRPFPGRRTPWQFAEAGALGALTLLLCFLVFFRSVPLEYGLLPLLIWACFRFGMRGTATAATAIAILATIGTNLGRSPFVRATPNDALLALDSFLGVTIIFSLVLAGVLAERERAAAGLRESNEKYRLLVENAGDAIFVVQDGKMIYANPRTLKIAGRGRDEVLGQPLLAFVHPDDRALLSDRVPPAGGGSRDMQTFRIVRPGGEERLMQTSAVDVPWEGRPAALSFGRDVTDQRRLEEQLRQSQKLEAIGTLAGGIAHDFNNILSVIVGNAELVRMRLPPGSAEAENTESIIKASGRATQLVARILAFSRRAEVRPVLCEVGPIVRETTSFLRSSLPARIEIREHVGTVGPVVIDPTQLHQVVMNLGTNAYHAMQERGGLLEVGLDEVRLAGEEAHRLGLAAGAYARLTVSDSGTGIPREALGRIFEPYFTTKAAGKGTGLGLSVVHGIVTAAGGAVGVSSEPGRGTTFHVHLPLARTGTTRPEDRAEVAPRGTGRVLVVDDEPDIAAMMRESLDSLGYDATTTTSAEGARALFLADPARFDLVITDLAMPKLDGESLARAVLETRPGLPVLVCTGFTEAATAERIQALGVRGVLTKPVTRANLARALREALERP